MMPEVFRDRGACHGDFVKCVKSRKWFVLFLCALDFSVCVQS